MNDVYIPNNTQQIPTRETLGGKASGLVRLVALSTKYGYNVPDFFVIPVGYSGSEENILQQAAAMTGKGNYAVRSSSPYEDSSQNSFAGMFETHLGVKHTDLVDAVRSVKASAISDKAQKYASERGLTLENKMSVIIQKMVDPKFAGVIYSTLPDYPVSASIEFCEELGKGVADGSSQTEIHDFHKKTLEEIFHSEERLWGDLATWQEFVKGYNGQNMKDAVELSQKLEKEFGFPLDIEFAWTFSEGQGRLYFLQARQITDVQPYQRITIPKFPYRDILLQSKVVRGIGEFEGPVGIYNTNLGSGNYDKMLEARRELTKLESAFPAGYVLLVPHFYGTHVDVDSLTSHKRVLVEYNFNSRSSHAQTVAREKGILYLGHRNNADDMKNFRIKERLFRKIKNGDIVKVVSNGRRGVLVKVKDGDNPLQT